MFCVYMYVMYIRVQMLLHMYVYGDARSQYYASSSTSFHFIFFNISLHWTYSHQFGFTGQPTSSRALPVFTCPVLWMHVHLEAKLESSCLFVSIFPINYLPFLRLVQTNFRPVYECLSNISPDETETHGDSLTRREKGNLRGAQILLGPCGLHAFFSLITFLTLWGKF